MPISNYIGGRTHFSLSRSIISPNDLVTNTATYEQYESMILTDYNSINALVKAFDEAKAKEIKVCIGASVRCVDDLSWRRAKRGEPKKKNNPFFEPKLIIKNDDGLKDLIELLTRANDDDHFYYEPQLDLSEILTVVSRGNLIMTSGDIFSLFSHQNYTEYLELITEHINASSFYCELVPVSTAYYERINELIALTAQQREDLNVIVSRPVLYREGEHEVRDTMYCIMNRNTTDELWGWKPQTDSLFVQSPKDFEISINKMIANLKLREVEHACDLVERAISCTNALPKQCEYEWHKLDVCLPHMSENSFKELAELAKEGWGKRLTTSTLGYLPPSDKISDYKERLKYELSVLKKMGFEDYFLLVRKIVHWSKEVGIEVGPARGSCAGSLVAYLIGITDVDPIRFGLIFERFINPSRIDLPDIDLDFMSSRREEVIQWLNKEYGKEYVACISNYGELGTASALRSVAKAHGMKEADIECSKQVPKEHGVSATLEESYEQVPAIQKFADENMKVFKEACLLQGTLRNYGQHAAGVIVAGEPIVNRAVVEKRAGGLCTNWDKRTVEDWGLIKLDVLGLSTLDMLSSARQYIKEATGKNIDYLELPLNDKKVLEAFGRGDTSAVFQFESFGMRKLLRDLATEEALTFESISAATALYRPGPMESGMMEDYVDVAKGFRSAQYIHPLLEECTKETNGILLYQEQIMEASRILAGFDMAEADHLRKVMGKKDPIKMASMRSEFVERCESHSGLNDTQATLIFDKIEKFAGYGFNKSHSVAYALISYFCQWVKVHHPAAFYAAALTILKEDKYPSIVRDANKNNVIILPPDINKSSHRFEIDYDEKRSMVTLFAPFDKVKGLSSKATECILKARGEVGQFESKEQFLSLVNKRSVNIRVQSNLDEIGAFASIDGGLDSLHPDRLKAQKTLLPGLVIENIKSDRIIDITACSSELALLLKEAKECCAETVDRKHPIPYAPKRAKLMIISDSPMYHDVERGRLRKVKDMVCLSTL